MGFKSVCKIDTDSIKPLGPSGLLGRVCDSLCFRSSLCICGMDVGVRCGESWEGVSFLGCNYLQGGVSEGLNDCLAVWVLKRSNQTEVIGLTSTGSMQVFV